MCERRRRAARVRGGEVRLRHAAAAAVRRDRDHRAAVRARTARVALAGEGRASSRGCGAGPRWRPGRGAREGRLRTDEGVKMMRRVRTLACLAFCTVGVMVAFAVPAGAQQLVDAGKEGDG